MKGIVIFLLTKKIIILDLYLCYLNSELAQSHYTPTL